MVEINKNMINEIVLIADKAARYCNLLVKQSDILLSAEVFTVRT